MKCLTPFSVKRAGQFIAVPCGKCPACLRSRRLEWSVRLLHEAERSASSFFITLTYNDDNVPTILNERGDVIHVLCKRDLQLFFKRLRKFVHFRYFAIGEYGSDTLRPHYHIVGFFSKSYSLDSVSDLVSRAWQKGFSTISHFSVRRAFYITKYHINPLPGHSGIPDSYKGFAIMSRRPGIGSGFIEEVADSYRKSPRNYLWNEHYKVALPRYYKDKIFDKEFVYDFGEHNFKDLYDKLRECYNEEEVDAMYVKAVRDIFYLFQYKSIFNSKSL